MKKRIILKNGQIKLNQDFLNAKNIKDSIQKILREYTRENLFDNKIE